MEKARRSSGTMQYQTRDRSSKEQGLFLISQLIWDPTNPLFFLFKNPPFVSIFSYREFFADEDMPKGFLTYQTDLPTFIYRRWFIKNTQEKHFELLIYRERITPNIFPFISLSFSVNLSKIQMVFYTSNPLSHRSSCKKSEYANLT